MNASHTNTIVAGKQENKGFITDNNLSCDKVFDSTDNNYVQTSCLHVILNLDVAMCSGMWIDKNK